MSAVIPIIEGLPPNTDRNNFSGSMGIRIECNRDIELFALGRPIGDTFTQDHVIKIWDENPTELASVTVNSSSPTHNGYAYELLETPITLNDGDFYRVASNEVSGQDDWYSDSVNPTPILDAAISCSNGCYSSGQNSYPNFVNASKYVWPNIYEEGEGGGGGGVALVSYNTKSTIPLNQCVGALLNAKS